MRSYELYETRDEKVEKKFLGNRYYSIPLYKSLEVYREAFLLI